jgi:trans-aconitate 2-methyltransferase
VTRADEKTRWDPAQYQRFERERAQPFHDLVARIPEGPVRRAADLGCGTGELTRSLLSCWRGAEVVGVDSSETMLERARSHAKSHTESSLPPARLRFVHADLRTWEPAAPLDRIVSNAALQWVADHDALLARLVGFLAPGGALWCDARFASQLGEAPTDRRVAESSWYGERLLDLGCNVDVWETVYLHRMDGAAGIVEWVKGTALRPVLSRLDTTASEAFLAAYTERVREAYPSGPHGTWFPFRRLFFVATRRGN